MTYVEHDLDVLVDLGVWWNERTGGLPMPLGGNVVRKDLGQKMMEDITMYTKMSIEHSISNPDVALQFAKNGAEASMMIPTKNSYYVCQR